MVKANKAPSPENDESSILKTRRQGREIAMQALYQFGWGELESSQIAKFIWLEKPVSDETRKFALELFQGTQDHLAKIDELIKKYSSHWTYDRIPKVELAILQLSIYSLLFLKEIPPIVIINEAIEISKIYSGEDAWRYINGMLDAIYQKEIAANQTKSEKEKN
jgi:N utilization substance protein B